MQYTPNQTTVMEMTLDQVAMNALRPRQWGQFRKFMGQFNGNIPTIKQVLEQQAPLQYLQGLKGIKKAQADAIVGSLLRAGCHVANATGVDRVPITVTTTNPSRHHDIAVRIGRRIIDIIKANNMDGNEFCKRADISHGNLIHWEKGNSGPSLAMMAKVLNVLWWIDARELICG